MPHRLPYRLARACLLALLVSAALPAVSDVAANTKETVALTFDWPSGLHGQVAFSARTTKVVNGRSEDISMSGRYQFTTSSASDGLLIEFDNIETEVENSGSGPQALVTKYMAKAVSTPPSYVVDRGGEFVRVEGLDEFRSGILDGIDDAFSEVPEATRAQIMQTLGAIFTREQVEASIVSEWNAYVGSWLDAEMDEGDVYELTYAQAVPAFGNMEVPMRSTFEFKRRVSCHAEDAAEQCVELEAHTFVDPAGLSAAVEAFIARLPKGQDAPRIDDLQQETVIRLISEPDTLLPHLMETSTRTVTTVSVGAATQSSSRVEEKRFVYSY